MPGRIRQSDIDQVKVRVNIADVVGEYVSLKSAGVGSLKGLCPFHDEKTPSFHVRPQVGFYHCFGCGESGDVFTFLQRVDHMSFGEAVEHLAHRAGVTVQYDDGGSLTAEHGSRLRILSVNAAANEFFVSQLTTPSAEKARIFLGGRGFDAAAAAHFGVGFAPKSWDELSKYLRGRGFSDSDLAAAGVVSSGDRGVYDRFRGRLVWPIRDITGQTIGFGARKLFDDDSGPKYLNTPETAVYRKAHVLYGLDLAKRHISRERRVVVVEGYTDVMACHLAGVTTAVATCGTAFGTDHITILRRILGDDTGTGEVIFTFDPDEAGHKAAMRAFAEERRFTAQTYVAVSEHGFDPCDLRLRRGNDAVRHLIDNKKPLFEFAIRNTLAPFDLDSVEGRVAALRAAAPIVAGIRDPVIRPGYTRELARLLGIDLNEVRRAVGSAEGDRSRTVPGVLPSAAASPPSAAASTEGVSQTQPPPPISLAEVSRDPFMRRERDSLMAILQYPSYVRSEVMDRGLRCVMAVPAFTVVRDAIRKALPHIHKQDWLSEVLTNAPESVRVLIEQLAFAPIPERSEAEMATYVNGVIAALIDQDMIKQKTELLGQLQRADPSDAEKYRALQQNIMHIESERRSLHPE